MTDNTEKELMRDLEAPQPTSTEADQVRGGNIVAAMMVKMLPVDLGKFVTPNVPQGDGGSGGGSDPASQFQMILNQITR
jgi:hypothetical protein